MTASPPPAARFDSILLPPGSPAAPDRGAEACMHDLNLDQVVAAIVKGWEDYDLAPFFRAPLRDADAICYRQEVMQDLERAPVLHAVRAFSGALRTMRGFLGRAEKSSSKEERERWFLDAVALYTGAVGEVHGRLRELELASRGLQAFRDYLAGYVAGRPFAALAGEAASLVADLSALRYAVLLKGRVVTVLRDAGDPDYTREVEATFEKFRRGIVRSYLVEFPHDGGLNHVEAQILKGVATLHPGVFGALERFCGNHSGYLDATIARFDREVQFYAAYLEHIAPLRHAGLPFSYPRLSTTSKELFVEDAFDLALAGRLVAQRRPVVCNGLVLGGGERLMVVSGPNQGGKTTFARMVGQVHFLAALGCAVPGRDARLFVPDRIFTHFECEEAIATLRGKLQDDLVRVREILDEASSDSLVIANEMFSSTTLRDALSLSREIMARLSRLDLICVWVTFLTELAAFDDKTVSLVSASDPRDPTIRTFKVERRPADGLAHAVALAEKYRVTGRWVRERVHG